jgi:signal transduction histidine kinase
MEMSRPEPVARAIARLLMSSRALLWAGFGSLLGLMILMAATATSAMSRIEAANAHIRSRFLERDELLDRLRADLFRSGIDLRDYLLHSDPQLAERRRTDILRTQQEMSAAVAHYRNGLAPEELAAVDELQRDLEQYFAVTRPALAWDAETRRRLADGFLREQIFPRRQQMLGAAERIRQIDTRQLEAGQVTQARLFAGFRREVLATALLAILLGVGLAVLTGTRVQKLERESEERYREVARTREELHRLSARLVAAQEEERRSLSRELHDEVGAAMSALLVELGTLASMIPPQNTEAQQQAQRVRRLAEANVGVVRNMSLLLRPSMLDDLGLAPALEWQARETARRTGIKVKVDAEDVSDEMPDEYRTCIYRVVQEALRNAARHSKASHVRVTVRRDERQARVTVADDGIGFHALEKGMGILGMEERVHNLGGTFHIESEPGRGTEISIVLPLACPVASRDSAAQV